ncbi:hypothetical protein [Neorhizobium sp. T25_13]|uniref:hypothetical protein n=1 Tax=Neorhizobium sp. T25_13 TaxID=2093830 RepID=UPI00155E6A1A|nr:hypothetical protein [Neorhizobium sp. T25_13]
MSASRTEPLAKRPADLNQYLLVAKVVQPGGAATPARSAAVVLNKRRRPFRMCLSRILTAAFATSTVGALALGAAMFKPDPVSAERGLDAPPQAFSAGNRDHILLSGHSLTDQPYPDHFEGIARQEGIAVSWRLENVTGSSIQQRTAGGFVRLTDGPYDVLIITEQHRVLDALMWSETVRYLHGYHHAFTTANPAGITYFYTPWISLSSLADPHPWIEYERLALPVWRCVVNRVNDKIGAAGRKNHIRFIPTSLALAELVARLASDPAFSGFEDWNAADRLKAIFSDEVHLTELGSYYVAAVSFAAIYGVDIRQQRPPALLDARQADALRLFAADFMQRYRATKMNEAGDCEAPVSLAFASHYANYVARAYPREGSYLITELLRIRNIVRFTWRFRKGLE